MTKDCRLGWVKRGGEKDPVKYREGPLEGDRGRERL